MADKIRLDVLLHDRGFVDSREKAKKLIKDGSVMVNGKVQSKAGTTVNETDVVELCGELMPYVSRGGFKLEKAVEVFGLKLDGCTCMDIGASTGGFTDCMLQNGAVKVFAVDVGSGQLSHKLLADNRVINMEQTNFRYLSKESIPDDINFASVDVSFISLKHIIPNLFNVLADNGRAACLIKPQFEAGKEKLGKNGIIKDITVHKDVVADIYRFAEETGFSVHGIDFSPIKGPKGNIEYLIYLQKGSEGVPFNSKKVEEIVFRSHNELDRSEGR